MKSNAPWSVKGIERDARETAKEAARREGMTVGEWLNQIIYTAGDPATSNGVIEGLKTSDLVTAIEHLNKRVISAESKGVATLDELARSFGGVVERLQRLERRPVGVGGAPTSPDTEERLARIEEKVGDRQRIDSLKALEKAITTVASQFEMSQKISGARIDAAEKQLQQLAGRLDAETGDSATLAMAHLKDAIDGMSSRLARAERIAAEASRLKTDAAEAVDAEFVDRTGKRLRVLGDEIKRGGDQIRSIESLVRKLSDQIDAAERRSSEGVQKVEETIAELRQKVVVADGPSRARAEIEAAVALVTQRTDDRIRELRQTFEEAFARGAPVPDRAERAPPAVTAADPASEIADRDDENDDALAAFDEAENAAFDDDAETFADDEEIDLDSDESAIATAGEAEVEAAFNFDLDSGAASHAGGAPDLAAAILSEVEDAFAGVKPPPPRPAPSQDENDGLDAILAELEGGAPTEPDRAPAPTLAAPAPAGGGDYLRAARRAAREAAEQSTARDQLRSKLSPRQRALLAAKIRRKRLAEQGLSLDDAAAPNVAPAVAPAAAPAVAPGPRMARPAPAPDDFEEAEPQAPARSVLARARSVVANLQQRVPKRAPKPAAAKPAIDPRRPVHDADDDFAPTEQAASDNPNLLAGATRAVAHLRARPVTLALGAAILLAVVALFFLVKDLMFGAPPRTLAVPISQPAADALAQTAPEVPAAPAVQPRALYLDAVARLKSATNDAETRAAIATLTEAATLGHPPAQLQLGELYKLGQGVEQDAAEARRWYERAATGGNVLAMHRVGVMAARGQGGPADPESAVSWFEQASNLGLVDSQYNLGAIFHPGGDRANAPYQDAREAYYWYLLAARNGDAQAGSLATGLAASLSAEERKRVDEAAASWTAATPDPDANEVAPAS